MYVCHVLYTIYTIILYRRMTDEICRLHDLRLIEIHNSENEIFSNGA